MPQYMHTHIIEVWCTFFCRPYVGFAVVLVMGLPNTNVYSEYYGEIPRLLYEIVVSPCIVF